VMRRQIPGSTAFWSTSASTFAGIGSAAVSMSRWRKHSQAASPALAQTGRSAGTAGCARFARCEPTGGVRVVRRHGVHTPGDRTTPGHPRWHVEGPLVHRPPPLASSAGYVERRLLPPRTVRRARAPRYGAQGSVRSTTNLIPPATFASAARVPRASRESAPPARQR
jgi:hypothetical protein